MSAKTRPYLWVDPAHAGCIALALVLDDRLTVVYMGPEKARVLGHRLIDLAEALELEQ